MAKVETVTTKPVISETASCVICCEAIPLPAPDSVTQFRYSHGGSCNNHFTIGTHIYTHTDCLQNQICTVDCGAPHHIELPTARVPIDFGTTAIGSRFERCLYQHPR
jgi:hypothetical protein